MNGQWRGKYNGSRQGTITVNIDERPLSYEGIAYLHDDDSKNTPSVAASLKTTGKDHSFKVRTNGLLPIDPLSGFPALLPIWEERIKKYYPANVIISKWADVTGSWENNDLKLSWKSNIGLEGDCTLTRLAAGQPSELVSLKKDWRQYKEYVANLKGRNYLFRGQNKPWRLRTSFHRAGRADLSRFTREDVPELHRHLSSKTKHIFNLTIPDENGGFFNLIQHHGYPTPILDWTYSPYVAAFFAYRGISKKQVADSTPNDVVRILIFDHTQWRIDFNQLLVLAPASLHFSVAEFIAIENERMIPQQAASTVTNIDDIESYIRSKESNEKSYLSAIDLPVSGRKDVTNELRRMGITAGSLFPGLDGMCEELKERNFEL
jgi:FRG domain